MLFIGIKRKKTHTIDVLDRSIVVMLIADECLVIDTANALNKRLVKQAITLNIIRNEF